MESVRTATEATAEQEEALFFAARGETIFGVLTSPTADPVGVGVISITGGAYQTSAHANRFAVRLGRRVAADGFHALRIDYHGLGESTGSFDEYRMDTPFVDDLHGAVQVLAERGIHRVVLLGSCFGGRTALAAAPALGSVDGVVAVGAPLIDLRQGEGTAARKAADAGLGRYLARGLHPRNLRKFLPPNSIRRQGRIAWAHLRVGVRAAASRTARRLRPRSPTKDPAGINPGIYRDLEAMIARRVPVLFVYGDQDSFARPFRGGSPRLAELLDRAPGLIECRTVEGARAQRRVAGQEEIIEMVRDWLARNRSRIPGPATEE